MKDTANIFNIQRFSLHDGPGIRTVVFLKGCPLSCRWCHNPESRSERSELSYSALLCTACGACARVCKNGCHSMVRDTHFFDRANCTACGACAEACAGALELFGKEMRVSDVLEVVLRDKKFYETSGGGLTVSGGEPMAAPDFTYALLKAAKEEGVHTAVETSGFCSSSDLLKVAAYTDLFLYDYKVSDSALHEKMTGVSNEKILENLKKLDALGKAIWLRCPIIPTVNEDAAHIESIAKLANSLESITQIDILPYHALGTEKAALFGIRTREEAFRVPEKEETEKIRERLCALCKNKKIT